jgi:hypothetical protein
MIDIKKRRCRNIITKLNKTSASDKSFDHIILIIIKFNKLEKEELEIECRVKDKENVKKKKKYILFANEDDVNHVISIRYSLRIFRYILL